MVKVRQDAWSHEDDLLLAETVLRHVREGSTQLNAFEEVGDHLNRTSAACGFRWNAEVRKKYHHAMELAKRQRKEKKRAMAQKPITKLPQHYIADKQAVPQQDSALTMDEVIHFLQHINKNHHETNQSKYILEQTQSEKQRYMDRVRDLEQELSKTKRQLDAVQEDYQVFIQIMDRARKMTVLDDQGALKSPTFRMDKNGNLEQLAQGQSQ